MLIVIERVVEIVFVFFVLIVSVILFVEVKDVFV